MTAKNVTLTLTGAANTTSTVTEGTSLRVAMSKVGLNATNYTFADNTGKVVSLDRKLSQDLNVVATAKPGITETSGTATASATTAAAAPAANTTTAAPAAASPTTPATPAAEAPKNVRIIVKGKFEASFEATAGSTLRAALTQAGHSATGVSFTDANGKAVGVDRKMDGDITLTSTARTSGG